MNYLTNYYKNLSEQLQERVNQLQVALNEYYAPGMERAKMDQKEKIDVQKFFVKPEKREAKSWEDEMPVGPSGNQAQRFKEKPDSQLTPEQREEKEAYYKDQAAQAIQQKPSTEPSRKAVPFPIKQPREELIRSQKAKQTSESMPYSEREELATDKEYNIDTNSIIKQTPDGRMIYGESRPKPTQQPNANYDSPYPMKNPDKKFQLFQTKETSPDLGRYGRNDGIDIMPEPRKDLVSSVNTESSPAFNIDLNLLRDKKLSDPRNRDEIDFSEIKKKLSRVAKNI
jgi:hypothetical protein